MSADSHSQTYSSLWSVRDEYNHSNIPWQKGHGKKALKAPTFSSSHMKCPYSRSVICCKSWLSYLTVKSAVCIYGIIPKTLKIDLNKINNWRCPNRHSWVATGFLRAYIFVDVVTVLVNDDTVSWVLSLIDCKESSLYWRIKGYLIRSKIYINH